MAFFGIVGQCNGEWMYEEMLEMGIAVLDIHKKESPELISYMTSAQLGDIIYIKSFSPSSGPMCILGAGYIVDDRVIKRNGLGYGFKVDWKYKGGSEKEGIYLPENYGFDRLVNSRWASFYKEFNKEIQLAVLELISKPKKFRNKTVF